MGDGENEPMENSEKKKLCVSSFLMIFHLNQYSEKKTGDPNFGGVSNWKFFCKTDTKEMTDIFQFFHNGQC